MIRLAVEAACWIFAIGLLAVVTGIVFGRWPI